MNEMLFVVLPYVAFTVAIVVSVIRWRRFPFTVSALSSQLLESRRLRWGSISFHWGIGIILIAHLAALVVPRGFELWNGESLRLYLLEGTGLAMGLWTLFGVVVLVSRRLGSPRIRAVTTPMDLVVLGVILLQVITGVWVAVGYRWGSIWGVAVLVPYVRSLITLQPQPELIAALPVILKLHVLSFFLFLILFPFSRLVHIVTLPLGYLTRPFQKVIRSRRTPGAYHPAADGSIDV
ncbi:MAG TPA: respiratory nitrate reductase subunit gamma [Acidimicrobiia bacterium]|nr:respiratory nitrate reductase subunit gamma [Acidimicrobiia bacterium]